MVVPNERLQFWKVVEETKASEKWMIYRLFRFLGGCRGLGQLLRDRIFMITKGILRWVIRSRWGIVMSPLIYVVREQGGAALKW